MQIDTQIHTTRYTQTRYAQSTHINAHRNTGKYTQRYTSTDRYTYRYAYTHTQLKDEF